MFPAEGAAVGGALRTLSPLSPLSALEEKAGVSAPAQAGSPSTSVAVIRRAGHSRSPRCTPKRISSGEYILIQAAAHLLSNAPAGAIYPKVQIDPCPTPPLPGPPVPYAAGFERRGMQP